MIVIPGNFHDHNDHSQGMKAAVIPLNGAQLPKSFIIREKPMNGYLEVI